MVNMYARLVTLAILIATSVSQEYTCGQPKLGGAASGITPDKRIVGGTDTTPGLFPWTLSVEVLNEVSEYELACGAVLIDPLWAVTSARCFQYDPIENFQVVAGQLNRSEASGLEQYIAIANIYEHPEFNGTEANYPNDIAILELAEPADIETEDRPIYPICLPPTNDREQYWENPQCYITGYGLVDHDTREYPDYLQQAWMEVIRPANCDLWWDNDEDGREILDTNQCVYDQVNRAVSICHNDNGGPLSCMVDARFDLAAVGSFYQHGCTGSYPSIYTNVPMYLDWIVEVSGVPPRQS